MTATDAASSPPDVQANNPLGALLQLAHRARHAQNSAELGFIAVNETHSLTPYRQAALWLADRGVLALSGVIAPEANAPFVHWLERIASHQSAQEERHVRAVERTRLPAEEADSWCEWLPEFALWVPLPGFAAEATPAGGLLLARDHAFSDSEMALLAEWADHWAHAWARLAKPTAVSRWRRLLASLQRLKFTRADLRAAASRIGEQWRAFPWLDLLRPTCWRALAVGANAQAKALWQDKRKRYAVIAAAVMLFPVRLTVLGAGELVPATPAVIRSPLDGTVDQFFVAPNARVQAGDKLFQLDLTTLTSKLELAEQALTTADAEYRQSAQQAVFDPKSKAQLAVLEGRIAERRAEAEYLRAQFGRAQVTAPRAGLAMFDDPSEWIGKPVVTGERVMIVSDEHDVEVEAWLAPGDIIDLPMAANVTLYLNSAPLSPVSAQLRYLAHDAVVRPDGSYAYRLRAAMAPGELRQRVGLKGTAKIDGDYVPLIYWVLRRPLAILRQTVGL